jgi:putative glutamine amidotransferase
LDKVKIGLTYTGNPEKQQFYIDWLTLADGVEVITLSAGEHNLDAMRLCEGLVLSGGRDIHPSLYNGSLNYPGAPEEFDTDRDGFELDALKEAFEKKMPVLGVCRGMQLINVACKGTLIQDFRDERLIQTHKGNPDKIHRVNLQEKSLLYEIAENPHGQTNSAHHQAVDRLGDGLMVNSLAEDGTVEGVEWLDKTGRAFLLGVQWHPERMFRFHLENTPLSQKIRERFVTEIKKNSR